MVYSSGFAVKLTVSKHSSWILMLSISSAGCIQKPLVQSGMYSSGSALKVAVSTHSQDIHAQVCSAAVVRFLLEGLARILKDTA
jgi:hypothetical protein